MWGNGFNYLRNGLMNWEMTYRFGKWAKYFGNGLDICCTAKVFEGLHQNVANELNILNMALMCGKRLKHLRNGFTMLKII